MATARSSQRLDKLLVAEGMVHSRTRAHQLIESGDVRVDGQVATKASSKIRAGQKLELTEVDQWVSRAAHKLIGALDTFTPISAEGKRCLDAGASTGGFTQVLLSRGAAEVVAADVGHGQLVSQLRDHPQVTNREGINLRYVTPGDLGSPFALIVADLSFISLKLVVNALTAQAAEAADLLLMVKPQFEIGRERLSRTGVVSSPQQRREALEGVISAGVHAGLRPKGVARSPLPGQDGNAEFFLWAQAPAEQMKTDLGDRLEGSDLHRSAAEGLDLDAVEFGDPAS